MGKKGTSFASFIPHSCLRGGIVDGVRVWCCFVAEGIQGGFHIGRVYAGSVADVRLFGCRDV